VVAAYQPSFALRVAGPGSARERVRGHRGPVAAGEGPAFDATRLKH
jgi:hypothetical protein